MSGFNLVDLYIVLGLLLYVAAHIRDGVLSQSERLVSLLGSAVLAFFTYGFFSNLLVARLAWPPGILDAATFLVLFIIFERLIGALLDRLLGTVEIERRHPRISKALAIIPAFIDGLIFTALILFLLVVVPILPGVKQPIEESRIGSALVNRASSLESHVDRVFGRATQETLGFLTIKPEAGESVELPFHVDEKNLRVDRAAEEKMLELVNIEREKVGAPPLVMDETLTQVARAHSKDMWLRAYFSHQNPDGEDPFDRMRKGGARFRTAGENLALARTVERAHEGLMNSPGHKRNILDPSFGRVGIGAINGGFYGLMFTQNFSN